MPELKPVPHISLDQSLSYRICVQGRLDASWSDHFDGLAMQIQSSPEGITYTTLSGEIKDQARLHGILRQIRDLGLPLILVEWIGFHLDGEKIK